MQAHQLLRERLRQQINQKNISAVELARRAGVKNSFVYDVLNGKSMNPSTVRLAQVANVLGVSLAYLAGSTNNPELESSRGFNTDIVMVPMLKVRSKDGEAVITEETQSEHFFKQNWVATRLRTAPENLRMLQVEGDGMAPTLLDNDLILIDANSRSPSPPGIFAVFDGLGLSIKRLEFVSGSAGGTTAMVRVMSDNARYGEYQRTLEDIRIIGRVVWFSREL